MKNAIILAAGKGTRMKSETNKCMQMIMGKPMLAYLVNTLKEIGVDNIVLVVGHQKESIIEYFQDQVQYVEQNEQ
ncbi:MAG: NTP transferase domain-containing protein [Erysipelotrichaceae bacterium]